MPSLVEMWFVTKPAKSLNDPIIIVTVFLSFPWTWQLFSCHSSKWGRLICKHCTVCYFTQQCYHTAGMQMAALFLERVLEKLETWEKNEIPYACITSIQLVQVQYLSVWAFCIWTIVQYDERIKKSQEDYSTCNAIPYFYCFFCSLFPFFPLYSRLKGVTSLDDRGLHFLDPSYSWFIFPYFPQHVPLSCSLVRIFYTV